MMTTRAKGKGGASFAWHEVPASLRPSRGATRHTVIKSLGRRRRLSAVAETVGENLARRARCLEKPRTARQCFCAGSLWTRDRMRREDRRQYRSALSYSVHTPSRDAPAGQTTTPPRTLQVPWKEEESPSSPDCTKGACGFTWTLCPLPYPPFRPLGRGRFHS
ncbi:hypothetical protein MRX96_059241 [Rhipicephalus microplus]